MQTTEGQPILILPEGSERYMGREAQRMNILAARIIAEAIRTTLGPKGMDKMLVDSTGDITITNDGATILKEIDVEHPVAKMIIEVAETMDNEVGDGTTSAVILTGELLKKTEELLNLGIHPATIAKGFRMASEKASEILDEVSKTTSIEDVDVLRNIVMTSMSGRLADEIKEDLSKIIIDAIKTISEEKDGKYKVDLDNIKIQKFESSSISETKLVDGIVLDKKKAHPMMPKLVRDAKIALIRSRMKVRETEMKAKFRITDPKELKRFSDEERNILMSMLSKIKESGANVVLCKRDIDENFQDLLAREGIFAVERVPTSDIKRLILATGAELVTNLEDLSKDNLGHADLVREEKIGEKEIVFIEGCRNPKALTILVRGSTGHIVDEIERDVSNGLHGVKVSIEDGGVVPGGGSIEVAISSQLRNFAKKIGGREQLAINSFAEALEIIPKTLAENAGLDSVDVLLRLKATQEKGKINYGIDVFTGEIKDMFDENVLEPKRVKLQAIKTATDTSIMILRIDDVIAIAPIEIEDTGYPGPMPEMEL